MVNYDGEVEFPRGAILHEAFREFVLDFVMVFFLCEWDYEHILLAEGFQDFQVKY
jgi:hypothetical protein